MSQNNNKSSDAMNSYPPWVRVVIHNGDMAHSGLVQPRLARRGREARRARPLPCANFEKFCMSYFGLAM